MGAARMGRDPAWMPYQADRRRQRRFRDDYPPTVADHKCALSPIADDTGILHPLLDPNTASLPATASVGDSQCPQASKRPLDPSKLTSRSRVHCLSDLRPHRPQLP
ncbi:hypothetical protein V3481_017374 [Fusarium oxysporum f. sp. vasinfectum]